MKFLYIITMSIFISGCGGTNIIGKWKDINPDCEALCEFEIVKKDSAYSGEYMNFNKGFLSKGASGPIIKDGKNSYIVKGSLGDAVYVLKNEKFYTIDNVIYEKNERLF